MRGNSMMTAWVLACTENCPVTEPGTKDIGALALTHEIITHTQTLEAHMNALPKEMIALIMSNLLDIRQQLRNRAVI
jgi:hypothetical protein